ncbi:MAG: hypothetical protein QXF55_00485 [Candidatus Aenigmatarchaeota archaeon]
MLERLYIAFCARFGKPFRSAASDELKDAIAFLGWPISPEDVVGAGKAMLLLSLAAIAGVAALSFFAPVNPLIIALLLPLAIVLFYAITEWPKSVAREAALAALGTSPYIVAQLAIPLKQKPNLEHALAFVAENAQGTIADDVREVVWATLAGNPANPLKGLSALGRKWGKWSAGFQRALNLIVASFHEADRKKKSALLDASVASLIEDIVLRTREYMQALNMPTLVLFSIGMVVPLMVVSMFPLVALFGFASGPLLLAAFLALSLAGTYLYSNMVVRKRPVIFAQPELKPSKLLQFRGASIPAAHFALVIAIIGAMPGIFYLLGEGGVLLHGPLAAMSAIGTIVILWAIAIAVAVYCYGTAHSASDARKRLVALEESFVDGLEHISNRLADGRPVEDAMEFAASLSGREAADLFASIAAKMRKTSQPFGKVVAELDTQSMLVKSALGMLAASIRHGLSATAQTAHVIAAHLKKMARAERSLRMLLQKSLSMMKATAATLAPVVCAIIVVLFQLMTKTVQQTQQQIGQSSDVLSLLQAAMSPELLQLIAGLYMLGLNFVLLRFVSRIQNGPDSISFRMALAASMIVTMTVFTMTLIAARLGLAGLL